MRGYGWVAKELPTPTGTGPAARAVDASSDGPVGAGYAKVLVLRVADCRGTRERLAEGYDDTVMVTSCVSHGNPI